MDEPASDGESQVKLGLLVSDDRAFAGYTLLAPMGLTKTYLIDMKGRVVRTWECHCAPALSAYLLENGNLLRPGMLEGADQSFGGGPGAGGRIQEYSWEGELVWDYKFVSDKFLPHHDVTKLPNGNVLVIAWDKKSAEEAVAAGRAPESLGEGHLLPDSLIEIKPTGKETGEIVWEWHVWDHLIQDRDRSKANFGDVAAHPELVDINFGTGLGPMLNDPDAVNRLAAIGYVAAPGGGRPPRVNADWTHFNSVAYNPTLDQIVVSVHSFNEIWIIDHSTTTAQAASHSGGRSGKGGDLLYRWGNPKAYRAGTAEDQTLFAQHHAHWIDPGLPGQGHLLVFNNSHRGEEGNFSSVDEVVLPVDAQGRYSRETGKAYGPPGPLWSYTAPSKVEFFSGLISGAQRLPNGHTLITSGINGTLFEVTPEKEIVWKYVNPTKGGMGPPGGGPFAFLRGGALGQVVPAFLRDGLKLTDGQKAQLDELERTIRARLEEVLTAEQRKRIEDGPRRFQPGRGFRPGRFGDPPRPGQVLPTFVRDLLELTEAQRGSVDQLQREVDASLAAILSDEQEKQLAEVPRFGPRGGFGPPGLGPPGLGGPDFGPPGGGGPNFGPRRGNQPDFSPPGGGRPDFGPGGRGRIGGPRGDGRGGVFGGPPGGSSVFRAYRYAPNFPGLAGRDVTPGPLLEELVQAEEKQRNEADRDRESTSADDRGNPDNGKADAKNS